MKKTLTIILVMACLLSFSACTKAGKPDESTSAGISSEPAEESETTSTSHSESEQSVFPSDETTETSESETSSESTETSAVTTPKPAVKVTTASKKTITVDGERFKVNIPKVTISGKDMSSVNKKIKNDITKKKWGAKYSYYKNDKIVSILVHYQGMYDADTENRVYNISVSTGKFISDAAVVKLYGSTDKKFFAQIKKAYKKDKFGTKYGLSKKQASKYLSKIRKRNLKRISYKYVDPYIDSKGKLKWVSSRYWFNLEAGEIELIHI